MNLHKPMTHTTALSLFANIGIAECFLEELGVSVLVANELDPIRGKLYQHLYPETKLVVGDITEDSVFQEIIQKTQNLCQDHGLDLLLATPPCQGMSRAGKGDPNDPRNHLIRYAVKAIQQLRPKYVLLENVPQQLQTVLAYGGISQTIPDYLQSQLGADYHFPEEVLVNMADYAVPQLRERAVFLLTRKDQGYLWTLPPKAPLRKTLADAIGWIPPLHPLIYDLSPEEMEGIFPDYVHNHLQAQEISPWHKPPRHVYRQVLALSHTPTGRSAFQNDFPYQPKKKDGTPVKGYLNTYKRQNWHTPAYTVTMYNRTIGSQNNVHPGRLLDNGLYSDPRVLTLYEIMEVMTLPKQWNIPSWVSENFLRAVIGEGIPPLFLKQVLGGLLYER